jgi:hypothetical protein
MKKEQLTKIIREELEKELAEQTIVNETYDLANVKYPAAVRTQVEKLVSAIEKTPNLNKTAIAAILNDVIMSLGLNRTQMTMYMSMIKMDRKRFEF